MTERILQKYTAGFFIIVLSLLIIITLKAFITAALGAVIFYILFRNFMRRMVEKRKFSKSLAAVIIIILSFFIVVLPLTLMGILIGNKIIYYVNDPTQINELLTMFADHVRALPVEIKLEQIVNKASESIGSLISGLLNNVFGALTTIIIMYFLLYFFLTGYGQLEKKIAQYLPMSDENQTVLANELEGMTLSNAVGVPVIAVAQGLIAYILYKIAGVEDSGLWATLTGAASIIPLVGTGIIWVPVSLVLLAVGNYWQSIFVAAGSLIILGNIDNLIRLVIAKRMADVHPVVTLLGVFFGLKIFGLPGLVFGPLLISYLLIFIKMFRIEFYNRSPQAVPVQTDNETIDALPTETPPKAPTVQPDEPTT